MKAYVAYATFDIHSCSKQTAGHASDKMNAKFGDLYPPTRAPAPFGSPFVVFITDQTIMVGPFMTFDHVRTYTRRLVSSSELPDRQSDPRKCRHACMRNGSAAAAVEEKRTRRNFLDAWTNNSR